VSGVGGYSRSAGRPLTPRMRDVLACAALGQTASETAAELGVAEATVKSVRAAALDRLGARNAVQAYALARDRGELA
jgi:LuxR family transcriptional regulator, regulator of acetate metabolism